MSFSDLCKQMKIAKGLAEYLMACKPEVILGMK